MEDYSKTLNLPVTDFPMRANLPQREVEILQKWEEEKLYDKLMEVNSDKPLFILHDGPPFANGDLHTGHALNKSLKDIITRFKNMDGYKAPYIHGWDTHGLPIETQAIKRLGINRHNVSPVEFREVCKDFALKYVQNQMGQLKRMGVLGDWDNSYITLTPEFEAKQIEIFGEMAEKGYIYKGLKPVYWCADCETALAEAEIEYAQDKSDSIYVKFQVKDDKGVFSDTGIDNAKIYFVIWTTTTWTLPGNVAICLNPEFSYSLVKNNDEYYVIATDLLEQFKEATELSNLEEVKRYNGSDLEYIVCQHPFIDRTSLVILGDHVTLDAGTGCVHTAPGHGVEDYEVCKKYKELPIIVPVDNQGRMNELAGKYKGLKYYEANKAILKDLEELGALVKKVEIEHQYPHCWRCQNPIIFRATEQWFASIDQFKDEAVKAIKTVKWLPAWGEERITNMVLDRADWCISRQRNWGVPIPIFYCKECKKELINKDTIKAVSELFKKEGSNAWYTHDASEILPEGTKCECGSTEFVKETDIMDVWFDSGSSHAAVLEVKEGLRSPADMYLEGNDQYRGWFQSSLLTSVATRGRAPYKMVITHGMVQDGEGRKMSKSKGNGIAPLEIIQKYGADILRLWVVSADYKSDVRLSEQILKQISEVYRKIRNTARFILGNLNDFDPNCDLVPYDELLEIDKFALARLNAITKKVLESYRAYEFHLMFHNLHNFCVVDMSNFYLDVIKDRLYTEKADGKPRRAAQTTMFYVLDNLVRLIAPVLAYTSDEIWSYMPHLDSDNKEGVILNQMPKIRGEWDNDELVERWEQLLDVKSDVSKALEIARTDKIIGHSLGASVKISASGKLYDLLSEYADDLKTIFIVSNVELVKDEELQDAFVGETTPVKVKVSQADGEKCERCWMYSTEVGKNSEHPHLCPRCLSVVTE